MVGGRWVSRAWAGHSSGCRRAKPSPLHLQVGPFATRLRFELTVRRAGPCHSSCVFVPTGQGRCPAGVERQEVPPCQAKGPTRTARGARPSRHTPCLEGTAAPRQAEGKARGGAYLRRSNAPPHLAPFVHDQQGQ